MLEFLPFGNVTLATLTLAVVSLVAWGVVEVGIRSLKWILSFDNDDAPEFTWKNPLRKVFDVLKGLEFFYKKSDFQYDGDYNIADMSGNYLTSSGRVAQGYYSAKRFNGEKEADEFLERVKIWSFPDITFTWLLLPLGSDILILLLKLQPLPTIIILGLGIITFSIRYLSGKFWSGMKNHKNRLDGHDNDIKELKSKVGDVND